VGYGPTGLQGFSPAFRVFDSVFTEAFSTAFALAL